MKALLSLLCLCALGSAQAQLPAGYDPEFDARERSRIQAERDAAAQLYNGEEADCYQRFAVNDCLREVRKRRRVTLEELRRQEIILNDARRAAAAAAQQKRVEEREAERNSVEVQLQREQAQKEQAARERAAQEKQANQVQRARDAASGPVAPAAGGARPATAEAEAARRAELQRNYEQRLQEAEERRRRREQQLKEQGPSQSKPLPVFP